MFVIKIKGVLTYKFTELIFVSKCNIAHEECHLAESSKSSLSCRSCQHEIRVLKKWPSSVVIVICCECAAGLGHKITAAACIDARCFQSDILHCRRV